MDAIKILAPGGYTTVQDKGRFGFQDMGIPVSGALDTFAFSLANLLVGNPENTAVLELTIMGPSLEIKKEMDMALTGAKMGIQLNEIPMDQWRSIRVKPGDIVTIGQVESGCRAYLAFGGGVIVPEIMGSFATYVGGKIGGFKGRPLQKDDFLETREVSLLSKERIIPCKLIPFHPDNAVVRAIPGPQDDYFDKGLKTLFQSEYMVTARADRMGYRLQGDVISIKDGMPKSIVSEPSMPGSIQIPPDEQPIILLVEQTVGGYAKIATVISSDLPAIAQTTPGDTIRFEKINLTIAHDLIIEEQNKINIIKDIFSNS
jgi:biotin-dependent carboxylase-like uncharacterized protein